MELFKDETIAEFMEYKAANPQTFSWWSYVNLKSDMQTALAFAKFYYPEIIEIDNYFLLKDKYQEDILLQWKVRCNGNKRTIEKMMNLYEVKDFFHINVNEEENLSAQINILADVIKMFWTLSFNQRYPSRIINVEVFEEWNSLFITVYES